MNENMLVLVLFVVILFAGLAILEIVARWLAKKYSTQSQPLPFDYDFRNTDTIN